MNRDVVIFFALLILIVICGVAIRLHFATEPLWIDELHTAWAADTHATMGDLISRAGQGNQTPLYFSIVWLLQQAIGFSVVGLRSISLVASSASILLAGILVRKWTSSGACGLLSAGIIAADYWCIFYGSEARPYALVQLLAVVQAALLCNEIKPDASKHGRFNIPLIICTAALALTHLTNILLIASQVIVFLFVFRRLNIRRLSNSFSIAILGIVICAPVLSHVLTIRSDWAGLNQINSLLNVTWPTLITCGLAPISMIAGTRLMGARSTKESGLEAIIILFSALLPLALIIFIQITGLAAAASYRYITYTTPMLAIFAGLAVSTINRSTWRTTICLAVMATALLLNPLIQQASSFSNIQLRQENWQQAIEQIENIDAGKQPLIFLFANLVEDHRLNDDTSSKFKEYISFPLKSAYQPPTGSTIVPMPTISTRPRWTTEHIQLIRRNGGCHLIARAGKQLLRQITDELKTHSQCLGIHFEIVVYEQDRNVVQVVSVKPIQNQADLAAPD